MRGWMNFLLQMRVFVQDTGLQLRRGNKKYKDFRSIQGYNIAETLGSNSNITLV